MSATTGYFGTFDVKLDEKSRIVVPSRIRETARVLGHDTWYMAPGDNHSILLFDRDGWNALRQNAGKTGGDHAQALAFRRMFFSLSEDARPDPQGRMPLPQHLREHAGINKDAVVIGVDDHLEVWDKATWSAFMKKNSPVYEELAPPLFASCGTVGATT
jgi:MraZ protein